ncbi:hypothetical protein ACRRTK_014544 [Alexandromys fortis]
MLPSANTSALFKYGWYALSAPQLWPFLLVETILDYIPVSFRQIAVEDIQQESKEDSRLSPVVTSADRKFRVFVVRGSR